VAEEPELPGADLVEQGLRDLKAGVLSVSSLLVLIGAPRLREMGIDVPAADVASPEHALYDLLARQDPDSAHARYNALIRRLVSFERARAVVRPPA
jgi:hypothetical protein